MYSISIHTHKQNYNTRAMQKSSSKPLRTTKPTKSLLSKFHSRHNKLTIRSISKRKNHTATTSPNEQIIKINRNPFNKPLSNTTYVGICLDGTSSDYITMAMDAGLMPNLKRICSPKEFGSLKEMMESNAAMGTSRTFFHARGVMGVSAAAFPTYTNPNNVSIITGVSPLHHGICGNYYFDEVNQKPVMMTSPELIRSDSILSKVYHNDPDNTRVTIVTSKDKLKTLLLHQLPNNFIGSELPTLHHQGETTKDTTQNNKNIRALSVEALNKFPDMGLQYTSLINSDSEHLAPSIYDPMNSVYALQLGYKFFKKDQEEGFKGSNIFYLSTTDYVQHKHAPGTPEANNFMHEIDKVVGDFDRDGAVVGITADHGMNQKTHFNEKPDITFLGTELDTIGVKGRVVLPITDPYVAHHGALGGYATIHLDKASYPTPEEFDNALNNAYAHLRTLPGCYGVIGRDDAKRGLNLPDDRIGDIVVIGHKSSVFGTREAEHDLSQLHGKVLRSHGSLEEALVPLIFNRPVIGGFKKEFGRGKVRNFDLFNGLFNGIAVEGEVL